MKTEPVMTLPVACPPSSSLQDPPALQQQRKRRRRAPASGASDDCFACVRRNVKCDRRRPYCSPCLEVGNECSGYKTQLTWGVGVASRGKLRGLSLPVARSAPVARSPPRSRPRASSTVSRINEGCEEGMQIKSETMGKLPPSPYTTSYDFVNMAPNGVTPPMPHLPDWNMSVSNDYSPLHDYHDDSLHRQRQLPRLQRLHTISLGGNDGMGLSSSVDSLSAYGDSDYASPTSQSFHDDSPYLNSPVPNYNNFSSRNSSADSPVPGLIPDSRGPTSCPDVYYPQSDMSSSMNSHQNRYDLVEVRHQQSSPAANEIFYDDEMLSKSYGPNSHTTEETLQGIHRSSSDFDIFAAASRPSHFGWTSINDDDAASQAASDTDTYPIHLEPMSNSFASDITPRISFFLDYYEKIICPSVVVIDSPSNPYREHILSLATYSKSLQHAICALSACNLRMKRRQSLSPDNWTQPPLELDFLDRINGNGVGAFRLQPRRRSSNLPLVSPDGESIDSSLQEEYTHRSLAVHLLNQQLSHPEKARHDYVLATLFILCHYRMCESGVAQFRTQFAGAKKLLGMRDSGPGNWGWMETLFTYFDGITASINDREAQLSGEYLELIAQPSNPNYSLENLAGCDALLFKTIGKLGRLNLLSQHRAVSPSSSQDIYPIPLPARNMRPSAPPRQRTTGLAGQALVDFYAQHAHSFDGNGFASTLDSSDAQFRPSSSISHSTSLPTPGAGAGAYIDVAPPGTAGQQQTQHQTQQQQQQADLDLQNTFTTEWKSARLALQNWEFSPARLLATLPSAPSPSLLADFSYISQAFRYAALLYIERLANPLFPSTHLNFQNLVSQVLYYVTLLENESKAEKFLLWPLFVAGSECVNETQRGIVRGKCREIMGRSGYLNNLAGLEVLEKLWAESGEDGGVGEGIDEGLRRELGAHGGPFLWTRYMEGSEGEWIMV